MNINFQTITGQKTNRDQILPGMEAYEKSVPGSSKSVPITNTGYALDIDATGFTDNAYAQHARGAKDISDMADNADRDNEKNFMILLSNTLSREDYEKALKDGFDLKDINSSEAVTIVDKIKSVLLQSGEVVAGYNDDMPIEKLKKLTGSEAFANALKESFAERDIPLTAENAKSARAAYEQIKDLKSLPDAAASYMVQNSMEPTIENIYLASHSTNGLSMSGRGFYAQEAGGYYAQKADDSDLQGLDSQIEKIIEQAGLDPGDEGLKEDSRWMIKKGIPLTGENLESLRNIKKAEIPLSEKTAAAAIASAIADGKKSVKADLSDTRSNLQKAGDILNAVKELGENEIKNTLAAGRSLTIKNLSADYGQIKETIPDSDQNLVKARLQLEEVRLRMTIDANKKLLDKGFSIDTAPMEELIERLKGALTLSQDEVTGRAVDEITSVNPKNADYVAGFTMTRISIIQNGPVDVVGELADELKSASLLKISETSESLSAKFAKAGEGYEKLMTAPRADLGDSIKKAFRNVDEILKDLDLEITEENRRAVRILGYNRMEVTGDNFEKVRSWDQKMQAVLGRLKPGAVLDLIRQGKNPLKMTLEELSSELDRNDESSEDHSGRSEDRYARFLYKLEHKKGITAQEKASFIGIYRLFNTLKRSDYQAIGSVLKTGREMTIGNLLGATRDKKAAAKGMDYTVDDGFGGLSTDRSLSHDRIDQQIETAFRYYRAHAEVVYENLEPEKLMEAKPDEATLLQDLSRQLQQAQSDKELDEAFAANELQNIRNITQLKAAETSAQEMKGADIELTFNNLEAYISEKRDRRSGNTIWEKAWDFEKTDLFTSALSEDDYEGTYVKVLGELSDKLSKELMDEKDTYIDVRAISLLQKQISVMKKSSERQSFEVPVMIDGDRISMNVTLKSDDREISRMEASVQTFEYGLISLSLHIEEGSVKGMLRTTNGSDSEETEYLEQVRSKLCSSIVEKLPEITSTEGNIAIIYRAQTGPATFGADTYRATEGDAQVKTDTRTLLTMAQAFIEALR